MSENSSPTEGNLGHLAKGHNSPADWARELFKPCKDLESLHRTEDVLDMKLVFLSK